MGEIKIAIYEKEPCYIKFMIVDRIEEDKVYGIKFYFGQNEFFFDMDYWVSRSWYSVKPLPTDRDRYFVRKGLVRLFHDSKR